MHQDIEKVLIHEDIIRKRVEYLAKLFTQDCKDNDVDEITVVILLKGALVFAADFVRHLDMKISVECINASSYHGGTKSSGKIEVDHVPDVLNKNILLIDDILDTGLTMGWVREKLFEKGAALIGTCVLLDKQIAEERCDYTGFNIPNEFVVGYGLDYQGHYRNLPYIGILKIDGDSVESPSP